MPLYDAESTGRPLPPQPLKPPLRAAGKRGGISAGLPVGIVRQGGRVVKGPPKGRRWCQRREEPSRSLVCTHTLAWRSNPSRCAWRGPRDITVPPCQRPFNTPPSVVTENSPPSDLGRGSDERRDVWALENDGNPFAILQTVAATRGAVNSLMVEIIEGHVRLHLLDPAQPPSAEQTEAAEELIDIVRAFLR
jgi:DNA-binding FrmR family transcriptional regulator